MNDPKTLAYYGNDAQQWLISAQTQVQALAYRTQSLLARQYLEDGVIRRLRALSRCTSRIYELSPPGAGAPVGEEVLADIEIYLNSFFLNIFGIFDNLAWAVYADNPPATKPKKQKDKEPKIGLLTKDSKDLLPDQVRRLLEDKGFDEWQRVYLKRFRDGFAHRIPARISTVCLDDEYCTPVTTPFFTADFETSPLILLHPQLIYDIRIVCIVVSVFHQSWLVEVKEAAATS